MDKIVAEIIKIIKGSQDSISREEAIKHYFESLACQCVSEALECIDKELAAEYGKNNWKVERLDERVIQASYGTIQVRRRRMKKEGEKGIYPLDKELGIRPYQRYSAYLEYIIAKIGAHSVYRVTAEAINSLTPITISHSQVGNVIKKVGDLYGKWEEAQEYESCEPCRPEVLYIEGDGLMLKGQGTKARELSRFQIAEGVEQKGKRRELTGVHYVGDFEHKEAVEQMANFLASHYDLTNTIVISNSDGGKGYSKEAFDELIGKVKRHEHFRDRYHVNRKCKERIGWAGKKLEGKLKEGLNQHDWEKVETALRNIEAVAENALQIEAVDLLRKYLERNWVYLASMKQRGLGKYLPLIGTCESNHRLYSYRMKKQGRRWGKIGGKGMVKVLTGLKNGDLRNAMVSKGDFFLHEPSTDFKNAVRNALKKSTTGKYDGIRHGSITVDAPSSSAIGQLAKSFVA